MWYCHGALGQAVYKFCVLTTSTYKLVSVLLCPVHLDVEGQGIQGLESESGKLRWEKSQWNFWDVDIFKMILENV